MKVTIYCDDSPHARKRAKIASLVRLEPSVWSREGREGWAGSPGASQPLPPSGQAVLREDEMHGEQAASAEDLSEDGLRIRHSFACPLCGLSVSVRLERLAPMLDGLARHGVDTLSLRALAARVSGT